MSHVFGCKQTPDTPPSTSDEDSSGSSTDGEAKKKKGNRAMGKNKYPKAIKYYSKAIKIDPKNPSYVLNRAIANAALELWKDAETDATRAMELSDPPSAKSHFQLARARLKRGHCEEALAAVKSGLEQYPEEAALLKLQKEIEATTAKREAKRQQELASAAAKAAPVQGPSGATALLDRARAACNAGKAEEAIPLLTEARADAQSRPGEEAKREEISVLSLLGKANMQLRQWQEAVQAYKALVTLEDELFSMSKAEEREALSNAYNNLGIAHKNAGQLQDAVDALNAAYQRSTNGDDKVATAQAAQILQNIAQCLRALRRPDEAQKTFARALEVGQRLFSPDHASNALSFLGIARSYRDAGRLKESIEAYSSALQIFMAKDIEECVKEIPEAPSKERVVALQQQCRTELSQLLAMVEQAQAQAATEPPA